MAETRPQIEARGLVKAYGERRIMDGLDLSVNRGETLVILGASGSGKSTLLRSLVGLERPDAGSVLIQGIDIFSADQLSLKTLRCRMGMAFQGGALFGSMTLAENVDLPLSEFTGLPASTRRIITRIKLGMVGLEDAMNLMPSQISGGMRKRAALARALALDPEMLFFDEPSAGLDPVTAAGLDLLILELKKAFQVTLVVVTHELASAFSIADRLALMHEGRFLVIGSPSDVQKSNDPIVRRFLDRLPKDERKDSNLYQRFIESEGDPQPFSEVDNES